MGTEVSWRKGEKTQIKFSARVFLDTLAGRERPERLARMLGDENNIFKTYLDRGQTISAISLEPGGLDNDDDQIVVEFSDDPAARVLDAKSKS